MVGKLIQKFVFGNLRLAEEQVCVPEVSLLVVLCIL